MPYFQNLTSPQNQTCSSALYCKSHQCLFVQNRNCQYFKSQPGDIGSVQMLPQTHANVTEWLCRAGRTLCTFLVAPLEF